ncbi:MAG: RAD55 family ATPase [Candidatus Kariarchaeaceae archaeon]|jgi:KaiC/GvpD/RAD55 family RecA-like ATPase
MFGSLTPSAPLCKFGLPSLDEAIGGGLPRGSTFVVEQTIGADADPFILSFLANGLQSMDYTYLLSTEQTFDHYKRIFQGFGRNPEMELRTGRLRFIDAFSGSFQAGLTSMMATVEDGDVGIERVADIADPREVNEAIRRSLLHVQKGPSVGIRGAVMSLSSIINTVGDDKQVFSFLQNRRAMDKLENSTTLISLNADAHEPTFIRAIEHMADGILSVTRFDDPNYTEPIQQVEVKMIKGKSELTGRKKRFQFYSGRIADLD